jgi:nucleoside-diphosphate-sugar epimerase
MGMAEQSAIVLAGARGDLGFRIAKSLVGRGADVRALVRPDVSPKERARLERIGLKLAEADQRDRDAMAAACAGATCVVSALNGLGEVILDRQSALLDAAVRAGVPRFISSDYSLDFTKTEPGGNRNLDLRREFMARADRAAIQITSVLNGAFMDMLGAEMPIIQQRFRRVLYWGNADQPLDFTTKDDVAGYTAAAALDAATPRILRIAGDTVSARDLAERMSEVTGERFATFRVGGLSSLGVLIRLAKLFAPQPRATFPPWQGMQYIRDMFGGRGQLQPLDNHRYADMRWTSVRTHLARRFQAENG